MLKIGSIRWRGKCSRHPGFDPEEGLGAVRGGCPRCTTLVEINELHRKMISLMRTFAPPSDKKKKKPELPDLQIGLFEQEP
ncbi:MAG TPA: hypothetical protein VHC72_20855 [Bryobacteraceae bacterium]|nr:hypothetical protein [Bryobacteraceae bacterium]